MFEIMRQLKFSRVMVLLKSFFCCCIALWLCIQNAFSQPVNDSIIVRSTTDFELTGNGQSPNWDKTTWNTLDPDKPDDRNTRIKTLYSNTGIYFLFHNSDKEITATQKNDFDSLWREDVAEVFIWPDTSMTVYFEYEISPLNRELVLIIPNFNGRFSGWQPWQYHGKNKVKHLTKVVKPKNAENKLAIDWYAEFFFPYTLLNPLIKSLPTHGSVWKANFYRVDYDDNKSVDWSWKKTVKTFHEYKVFGRLVFD